MDLEVGLLSYSNLGLPKKKHCLTGSSGIALYDRMARERGYTPLLADDRILDDMDIYTGRLGSVFSDVAHNANFAGRYLRGTRECVTFDLDGASYDVSCKWPFLVAADDVEEVSEDVCGVPVMALARIAECKRRLARPKDLADLRQIEIGLGLRRG